MEHEVLPSHKDRYALTVWASSSVVASPPSLPASVSEIRPHRTTHHILDKSSDLSLQAPLLPITASVAISGDLKDNVHFHSPKIFVSIVNYCDSEGPLTVLDLVEKASFPDRIFVGYVYQGDYQDEGMIHGSNDFESERMKQFISNNFRSLYLPTKDAHGPCYARHLASTLWENEPYYLQIDSHMRFRPGWDSYLIDLYEKIKTEQTGNPVITTYPLGYTLPNNVPSDIRATVLVGTLLVFCYPCLSFS
jgi:hypothetical protein